MIKKMPNLSQLKRLTLVIAIPLLILGYYLTDEGFLIDTDFFPVCVENPLNVQCGYMTYDTFRSKYNGQPLVTLGLNTNLLTPFSYRVMLSKHEFTNWKGPELPLQEEGEKLLVLPFSDSKGSCFLGVDIDKTNIWYYTCGGAVSQQFSFLDEKVNLKFTDAMHQIIALEQGWKIKLVTTKIASTLIPLIVYFGVFVVGYLLLIIGRYVRTGRGK